MKLSERQKKDIVVAYARGQNAWGGLKTGWALYRKKLVELSKMQLRYWTMWTVTEHGIEVAKSLMEGNDYLQMIYKINVR